MMTNLSLWGPGLVPPIVHWTQVHQLYLRTVYCTRAQFTVLELYLKTDDIDLILNNINDFDLITDLLTSSSPPRSQEPGDETIYMK